jgi:hypothetical protein
MPKTQSFPVAGARQEKSPSPVEVTSLVKPLYLDIYQLAEAIPASRRSIDNWKQKGWIPYYKIGGMIRYDLAAVRAALEKRFLVHSPARKPHKTTKARK